jgi:quercetin dioxygenase-like cupin family protein
MSSSIETMPGPGDWFTGVGHIDALPAPSGPFRIQAALVHFAPGARTAWHTHPKGPNDLCHRGFWPMPAPRRPVEVIRPGDRVFFEVGEEHWHGAAANRFLAHLAIQQLDEQDRAVTRGESVTEEEYGAAPAT